MSNLLDRFYSAFGRKDWATMNACYHPEARFDDPVFPDLNAQEVKAMWKMLLSTDGAMRSTYRVLEETASKGACDWEAFYNFSKTGRPVHNIIHSEFELRDGLIFRQRDHFNFWRWSRQALGMSGLLLGWTPIVKNKVRGIARAGLERALAA